MTEQEQLEQIKDPSPTPAELMIEPEQFDRHRDELNEAFRVVVLWVIKARSPAGIAARLLTLSGALDLGEPMSASEIAKLCGCSKANVSQLSAELRNSFGIVHVSTRTKGRG
jgi:DNA-binding transcriptional regulator GbsR (MarR family)